MLFREFKQKWFEDVNNSGIFAVFNKENKKILAIL